MSITYSDPADPRAETAQADPSTFTPHYARHRTARRGKVKTWMILAPIGVLTIGGIAAALSLGGGERQTRAAELCRNPR